MPHAFGKVIHPSDGDKMYLAGKDLTVKTPPTGIGHVKMLDATGKNGYSIGLVPFRTYFKFNFTSQRWESTFPLDDIKTMATSFMEIRNVL